jgi:hypothetical protein
MTSPNLRNSHPIRYEKVRASYQENTYSLRIAAMIAHSAPEAVEWPPLQRERDEADCRLPAANLGLQVEPET